MYGYLMQHNATAHTANFSVTALEEIFGKWLITHGLWPPRFPYLKLCVYLWGTPQDRVCVNNPHYLQVLKDNIQREISNISGQELHCVSRNILRRCEACLEAEVGTSRLFYKTR
jgi:hypothetical protein